MNRRLAGVGVAAGIVIVALIAIATLPKHTSTPPARLVPSATPTFAIRTANDLYTVEARLNAVDVDRHQEELKTIDQDLKQF